MSPNKQTFTHPQYGKIELTINNRARRIIMRACPDVIRVTIPPGTTEKELQNILDRYGDKLKERQQQLPQKTIDNTYTIDTPHFSFRIKEITGKDFQYTHSGREYILFFPKEREYTNSIVQQTIRNIIKKFMQHRAKEILLPRLASLSQAHSLPYNNASIRDSHTRWGSCNNRKEINLSIYLLLLPDELIDYVILHELCHTVEMNHSPRFWALADKVCGCNSKELRKKLKKYNTDI